MAKFFIHQLLDGKMLIFEDGIISVEETGYPLPDCFLPVGNKEYKGQEQVMKALLGYDIESHSDFAKVFCDTESMSYTDFKLKVQSENIGGGCPERLRIVAKDCINNNISYTQSLFKHFLPEKFINNDCVIPVIDEYIDMLWKNWKVCVNKPNSKFRNNIIMYLGIRNFTDDIIVTIKSIINICMSDTYKEIFKYISVITAENGVSALLLIDSVLDNADLEYFYSTISGVDLSDGNIIVTDTEEGIELSFNCIEPTLEKYYENKKPFSGNFKHYII